MCRMSHVEKRVKQPTREERGARMIKVVLISDGGSFSRRQLHGGLRASASVATRDAHNSHTHPDQRANIRGNVEEIRPLDTTIARDEPIGLKIIRVEGLADSVKDPVGTDAL